MNLPEFKSQSTVIQGNDAKSIRIQYIDRFVDPTAHEFPERIASRKVFKDGSFYTGYLWDFLKGPRAISEREIYLALGELKQRLLVLWDLHSEEHIRIPGYWKFPREAILQVQSSVLLAGLQFLPEDLYIFDGGFRWSFILTHEYTDRQERVCAVVGSMSGGS